MQKGKDTKVGIGFATGRKSFQKVLRTYIYSWNESGLVDNERVSLNLFVAYDLTYNKTKVTDYTKMHPELVEQIDSSTFIAGTSIEDEINYLIQENVINLREAKTIFGKGYAAKRNAILYYAIKHNMDYLIFLDDDEYPLAVTETKKTALWGGQHVLSTHLKYINLADITYGYHCGYISPIPYMQFNETMTETDFRSFIEAISNDIVNWDTVIRVIANGGVTYADKDILTSYDPLEVQETNHAKFISGANLCINLTDPNRIFPFYNPPGARGEDTFLSTCLRERNVMRVPCYTFHDGFSTYHRLLEGVLPTRLKFVEADNEQITTRFYKACIGWIRYKPLLLYVTQPDTYEEKIEEMREKLKETLPKIATYFQRPDFIKVLTELDKYHKNVEKHYRAFKETQRIWAKIMEHFSALT
ncbi:MAG: hypothetical protein PHY90_03690 [Desulfitobacteriaceae bacterium]|nr:hypothetical protein [Desulfitobacteriaceae bacterium]